MAPDLDIGVIYTHERELMPRLLGTMRASCRGLRVRLILVDNASRDGVEPWCAQLRRDADSEAMPAASPTPPI